MSEITTIHAGTVIMDRHRETRVLRAAIGLVNALDEWSHMVEREFPPAVEDPWLDDHFEGCNLPTAAQFSTFAMRLVAHMAETEAAAYQDVLLGKPKPEKPAAKHDPTVCPECGGRLEESQYGVHCDTCEFEVQA